jgi:hypothetical protein
MSGGNAHERKKFKKAVARAAVGGNSTSVGGAQLEGIPANPATLQSPEHEKSAIRFAYHLRAIGFVSFVFAIGAILMEHFFWWFVGFTIAALVISIIDSIVEVPLGKLRYLLVIFFAICLTFFIVKVVIGSVYVETTALWTEGNYTPGEDVHGLIWQDGWSDLRISIFNHSKVDVKDLDVEFVIDESVAGIKPIGDLKCSVIQSGPTLEVTTQSQNGTQEFPHNLGINAPYRLLCDKLPGNTGIQITVALANTKSLEEALQNGGSNLTSLLGPKRMPRWDLFHFSFKAGPRPYNWDSRVKPTMY